MPVTDQDLLAIRFMADWMRDEGGSGMELLDRSQGGARLRLWMPSSSSAEHVAVLARNRGWHVAVVPHYTSPGALRSHGVQVIVDLPVPTSALGLPAGPVRQLPA
jgi:hypothetical protein